MAIIEAKEPADQALMAEAYTASVTSSYRSQAKRPTDSAPQHTMAKCTECGRTTPKFGWNRSGKLVECKLCTNCFTATRPKRPARWGTRGPASDSAAAVTQGGVFDVIGGINTNEPTGKHQAIDNMIFDGTLGWHATESRQQPTLDLHGTVDEAAYEHIGIPAPSARHTLIPCISDTGAKSCLMGLCIWGNLQEASVMAYVSPSMDKFYLSRTAMEQLKVILPSFPWIGYAAAIS